MSRLYEQHEPFKKMCWHKLENDIEDTHFSGERGAHLHRVKSVVSAFDKIQDFGVHPTTKPKVTPRPARPVRPTGNAVPRPYRP